VVVVIDVVQLTIEDVIEEVVAVVEKDSRWLTASTKAVEIEV
jgi:hypothetical protein